MRPLEVNFLTSMRPHGVCPVTRREKLIQWLTTLATIALSVVAARYGIPIPPPPPIDIPAPVVVLPPSPKPPIGPENEASPQPAAAIVRLSFTGVGCSGTVIGPRRADGRWWVMTAAHCCKSVGQHGTIRFLDGRYVGVTVASIDAKPDVAWLVTDPGAEVYPFALLARSSPAVGTKIWHAGYGVDRPGNREEGEVLAGPDTNGQLRFRLSVSSGDSGGGILMNENGEVLSAVCCTSSRGQLADVWGVSPEAAARAKPTAMVLDNWAPSEIPIRAGRPAP